MCDIPEWESTISTYLHKSETCTYVCCDAEDEVDAELIVTAKEGSSLSTCASVSNPYILGIECQLLKQDGIKLILIGLAKLI